jgi:hypothetical protein
VGNVGGHLIELWAINVLRREWIICAMASSHLGQAKRNRIGGKTMNGRMDGASIGPEMEKEWELLGKLMYTGIKDGKNFVKD